MRLPYSPIFLRRRVILTSIVLSKTYTSSVHIFDNISSREKTCPGWESRRDNISNSFLVNGSSVLSMNARFFTGSMYNFSNCKIAGSSFSTIRLSTALTLAITSRIENGFDIIVRTDIKSHEFVVFGIFGR